MCAIRRHRFTCIDPARSRAHIVEGPRLSSNARPEIILLKLHHPPLTWGHRVTKHPAPDRHRHVDGFATLNNMTVYGCPSLSRFCSYTIWRLTDSAMVHFCVVS